MVHRNLLYGLAGVLVLMALLLMLPKKFEMLKTNGEPNHLHNQHQTKVSKDRLRVAPSIDNSLSPPCGEVCDFSIHKSKGMSFVKKNFNCHNIFLRLKYPPGKVYKPPLREPPKELLDAFTQNGDMALGSFYMDGTTASKGSVFKIEDMNKLIKDDKELKMIGSYGRESAKFKNGLSKYKSELTGKSGIVIGSIRPWIEVMLINIGVKHVTTVDYNSVIFEHPQISFKLMPDLADESIKNQPPQFDFAASFSSLEHSGLGRYGDPINPYGDFEAAAQIWCMLKPGGLFFLGVPASFGKRKGTLDYNAHRIYGEARIEQLTANFEEIYRFHTGIHGVFVLRKRV
ncbi:uncharacterized protein LOC106171118 [Lingula anatina]|uniref:Uncharacterized protein LOC106171118 n=1 Tax=Lingula anatina TaxID=7574 RepID=A0A1S3JA26_LINAN|nr:uncharacterized protein LOC106171118 [Lingula anatina]XP_013406729.1 uncharacterized protein LOC106171118 [Lingula anatina]|eukprot:XP_013406728.1 uncharacterized protein LOC106171118 [Lingula anatina]